MDQIQHKSMLEKHRQLRYQMLVLHRCNKFQQNEVELYTAHMDLGPALSIQNQHPHSHYKIGKHPLVQDL